MISGLLWAAIPSGADALFFGTHGKYFIHTFNSSLNRMNTLDLIQKDALNITQKLLKTPRTNSNQGLIHPKTSPPKTPLSGPNSTT